MAARVRLQEAAGDELPDQRHPEILLLRRAAAEAGEPFMAPGQHLFGLMAGQDVDDMRGAEALAALRDGRQDDARLRGAIGARHLVEAVVAIAARLRLLAEIAEQHLAPALRRLAIADQGVEPLMRASLVLADASSSSMNMPAHADVAEAEQHVRLGIAAVAAGAADLLIIGLQTARHIGVEDIGDVGLVDAHAEGDGRHHDDAGAS